jgi:hypothetical protein
MRRLQRSCHRATTARRRFQRDRDAYLSKGHIAPAEIADDPVYG